MLLSIIIPSFNQAQFIEETLKSVLNQNYKNKEIIVVDNLSTDDTPKILKKYQEKIKVIREEDNGQSEAINKGFRMSRGDILAYLNSDDLYEKETLRIVADFFKENKKAKIVYGVGKFIDEKGKFLGYYNTREPTLENLFKECVVSQPTVFMRKEVYQDIGPFDENLHFAMDYDYWIRVAKKYQFYFINKPLASTRLHQKSKTAQSENVFEEILKVIKKNYGRLSDEAIFNYAYVKEKDYLRRILQAIKLYFKYNQLPTLKGLKYFGILFKSFLFKK